MTGAHAERIARARELLLAAIGAPRDLTLVRPHGNIGDRLIQAGTRRLLASVPCRDVREVGIAQARACSGDTVLLGGSGGWCGPYHGLPELLPVLEQRFERVLVLPSSFDTSVPLVREALARTRATVFAREPVSFARIEPLCRAELAHDCAFFYDYAPYRLDGVGELVAFRTDLESARDRVPPGNRDISVECSSLDEWLWTIARHARVRTDRAHVTIAAALLGKTVAWAPSSYHKVPAIVAWSLPDFPATPITDTGAGDDGILTEAGRLRALSKRLEALVPTGASYVLVDEQRVAALPLQDRQRLPFLERDGTWWGRPSDGRQAIRELERMRDAGAGFLVFAWPALWWLEYYAEFAQHVRDRYRCLAEDEVAICFDLRQPAPMRDSA